MCTRCAIVVAKEAQSRDHAINTLGNRGNVGLGRLTITMSQARSMSILKLWILSFALGTISWVCQGAQLIGESTPLKERFSTTILGDYVAAGVDLPDRNSGSISLGLPPLTRIVKAFLYWSVIDVAEGPDLGEAVLNNNPVQGKVVGRAAACRRPFADNASATLFNFRADVTDFIVDERANSVSIAPHSSSASLIPVGATLIAVYLDFGAQYREIVIEDGAVSFAGPPAVSTSLAFSKTFGRPEGKTTWILAPGQPLVSSHFFVDGIEIADPALAATSFWDTRTEGVTFPPGNTAVKISTLTRPEPLDLNDNRNFLAADCLTWVGQVLSVPTKPPPVIIVPGTGASELAPPGIEGNVGWPLDVLSGIGHPQNLQFMEDSLPRRDTISPLMQPDCCLAGAAVSGGGEHVPIIVRPICDPFPELLDPPPFFGQLLGGISSMEAFLRDSYDSINFRDPGPGFPNSSEKGQFVATYVHDFRYPLATNACELGNWVHAVQFVTGSRKVDLVGHSRGNLVIKEYLNDHPETVRAAVLIAPPNLGAPKTLKVLRFTLCSSSPGRGRWTLSAIAVEIW
jgi:hypothetical protein